jgi:hypothetical protein
MAGMAGMLDLERRVERTDDGNRFVTRRIAGETVIVPVSGHVGGLNAVYTLNEVGSFIWRLIDGRRSGQAIANAVGAEYEVAPERVADDVAELLATLEANGLVRPAGESRGEA